MNHKFAISSLIAFAFAAAAVLFALSGPSNRLSAQDAKAENEAKATAAESPAKSAKKKVLMPGAPNIVYILCDDLGIGDVHAMNALHGKIDTKSIDTLAAQGMTFTDCHSGSAVCTPSRYGILTGRYSWRTHLQKGVLNGMSPPLIAGDRLTAPGLLREHGYATGMVGKWHLGLKLGADQWKDPIQDGPLQHGFDYFYGISASLDMPPFVFLENDRVTEVPSVEKKWIRTGPAAPSFEAVDVLPTIVEKAGQYLNEHAEGALRATNRKPFFLYVALTSPHTPIVPSPNFVGRSGLGPYGDFVLETDWAVGEVLNSLARNGLTDNTLVIFTSDNGCSPAAKVDELEKQGHYPSADYRGYKADIWEGGHHIPFIAKWPNHIPAGSKTPALTCQTDLFATVAEMVGEKLPDNAGEDSISMWPVLVGANEPAPRDAVVHHSIDGSFSIRQGGWKLELCNGSGGWAAPREAEAIEKGLPDVQLYDMISDSSEKKNVAKEHPEVVKELTALLQQYIDSGRSTPGKAQANDVKIKVRKVPAPAKADNKKGAKKEAEDA
jgi:arylsulfatase A